MAAPPTRRGSEVLADPERLSALRALGLLDEPLDDTFDRIARLAARATGADAALVTLVSADEQHFVGRSAPGPRESPITEGFCPHTVIGDAVLRLDDVRGDPAHAGNPAAAKTRAYLGRPVHAAGQPVGAVSVVADAPRTWSPGDRAALEDLAAVVVAELTLRTAGSTAREHALAAERERRSLERLNALVTDLSATVGLQAILEHLLQAVLELFELHAGAVMLTDPSGMELHLAAEAGLFDHPDVPAARLAFGEGASGQAAATGRPARVTDLQAADVEASLREAARRSGLRGAYAEPLVTADGIVVGTVTAYAERAWSPSAEQAALVALLARTAAGLVAAARHAEEREDVVALLQASLRPTELPETPGFAVAGSYLPFSGPQTAGGDFYDVLEGRGEDELVLLLGDICGKGPRAAALTALARHSMRAAVLRGEGPPAVLRATNTAVLRGSGPSLFATGVVAAARRREDGTLAVRIAAAGHPPPLLVARTGDVTPIACDGTALGIIDDIEPVRRELVLTPGDALVLYTDGLTDAWTGDGDERLGDDGLLALAAAGAGGSAAEQAEGLAARLQTPPLTARDDMALLVLACPG